MSRKQLIFTQLTAISLIYVNIVLAQTDLTVDGIFFDEHTQSYAIVNGVIVKKGDTVGGAEVAEINKDFVKFKYKDNFFIKKIGDGVKKKRENSTEEKQGGGTYNNTIKETEVKEVVLKIFENLGRFEGYLIFYNKDGQPCAVGLESTSYIQNGDRFFVYPHINVLYRNNIIFDKKLEINQNKFQYLKLRGGDTIFAYPVEIFIPDLPKHKRVSSEKMDAIVNTITFEFTSNYLHTQEEVRLSP